MAWPTQGSPHHLALWPFTWDALGPADGDHNLSVKEVTEGSYSWEVSIRARWVRHGIQLFRLYDQQVGHQCIHWGCSDSWKKHSNSSSCRPFGVKHLPRVSPPMAFLNSHWSASSDTFLWAGLSLSPRGSQSVNRI